LFRVFWARFFVSTSTFIGGLLSRSAPWWASDLATTYIPSLCRSSARALTLKDPFLRHASFFGFPVTSVGISSKPPFCFPRTAIRFCLVPLGPQSKLFRPCSPTPAPGLLLRLFHGLPSFGCSCLVTNRVPLLWQFLDSGAAHSPEDPPPLLGQMASPCILPLGGCGEPTPHFSSDTFCFLTPSPGSLPFCPRLVTLSRHKK